VRELHRARDCILYRGIPGLTCTDSEEKREKKERMGTQTPATFAWTAVGCDGRGKKRGEKEEEGKRRGMGAFADNEVISRRPTFREDPKPAREPSRPALIRRAGKRGGAKGTGFSSLIRNYNLVNRPDYVVRNAFGIWGTIQPEGRKKGKRRTVTGSCLSLEMYPSRTNRGFTPRDAI